MTGWLRFHLDAESSGESRATARLQRLANLDGLSVDDEPTFLRVQSGREVNAVVEPGFYAIDVRWRNGQSSRYNCLVAKEESRLVDLVAPLHVRRVESSSRDFTRPSAGGMSSLSNPYEVFATDDRLDTWRFVCDRDRIERQSQLSLNSLRVERVGDVKLSADSPEERNWVEYWADDGWRISTMPFYPRPDSDLCVLRSAPIGVPFIVTGDPDTAVMEDLIPAGNSESARVYARTTFEVLTTAEKDRLIATRPLEICAFAYAEYDVFDSAPWIELLKETVLHEAWLPDVSVVLGWRLLMASRNHEQRQAAAAVLEKAVDAGVPYYAMGVRLLSEALGMLAGESERMDQAASLVKAVALRTIATEAFTTVRP